MRVHIFHRGFAVNQESLTEIQSRHRHAEMPAGWADRNARSGLGIVGHVSLLPLILFDCEKNLPFRGKFQRIEQPLRVQLSDYELGSELINNWLLSAA
jgi:hypothetical protein